jgi:autotransporter-associated beta strand protein
VTEPLSLSGSGIFGTGALENIQGSNTWAGPITLTTLPGFSQPTSPSGFVTINVPSQQDTLTISGAIGDDTPSGLAKIGAGSLTLSGNNTYEGTTDINAGLVTIQSATALGAGNGNAIQRVTVTGTNGTFKLTFNGKTTSALAYNAPANTVQTALQNLSTIGANNVAVTATTVTVNTPTGPITSMVYSVTFVGTFSGKAVPLMTATPGTNVTAFVSDVADGGIGTLVSPGTQLNVDLDPTGLGLTPTVAGEPLTLNGTGLSGAGALLNISGMNTWTGGINLATSSAIGVNGGSFSETGVVSGPASSALTKIGPGTLNFSAANTYGGTTFVNQGILDVSNPSALGGPTTNDVQTVTINGAGTGFFTLTFNGFTTSQQVFDQTTAASLQAALDALPSIGANGVTVKQGTGANQNVFTITFSGAKFAGQDQNQMTAAFGNGVTSVDVATTIHGGLGGTTVASGATLQISGSTKISTESLTMSGTGVNGIGALDSLNGNNIWDAPIVLTGDTNIGAESGSVLDFDQPIKENLSGMDVKHGANVTKVGAGTIQFTGTTSNTYTGITTVQDGTLQLGKSGTGIGIPGKLVVGTGTLSPGSAVLQLLGDSQLQLTTLTTVNGDGLLDLNNHIQEIGSLFVVDGTVQTGAGGTGILTLDNTNMTGGTLTTGAPGSKIILAGDVTATSSANQEATITGSGTFSLNGTDRTFNVTSSGLQPSDLNVNAVISGTGSEGIIKSGTGRLQLDQANTFTGLTTIDNGDVQVDRSVGNVVLNGTGSVSGTGTVGLVTGPSNAQAAGSVAPGDNGLTGGPGLLTTGDENWGTSTQFSVDLNDPTQPAGIGYDQLFVNGNINLGGATVTGNVAPSVTVGDSFTVIKTAAGGVISGQFTSPQANTVFVNGPKFGVVINHDPTGDTVVFTRELAIVTMNITSSVTPTSRYGQDYVFTAHLTPEKGAGNVPTTDTVTFVYDNGNGNTVSESVNVDANGNAVFDPQVFSGLVTSVGSHLLQATFNGDTNYQGTSGSYTQTVIQSDTVPKLTFSPPSPQLGQAIVFTAQFTAKAPGVGIPTGFATFTIDGSTQQTVQLDPFGVATLTVNNLPVGGHNITVNYSGDQNFNGLPNLTPLTNFTITKDLANLQVVPSVPSAVYKEPVQFTATVSSGGVATSTPTGTVDFYDGPAITGTHLGTITLTDNGNGTASATLPPLSSLSVGMHTITVVYNGDTTYSNEGPVSITFNVNSDATSTTVTSSANPSPPGSPVTFKATVQMVSPATGVPIGSVQWVVNGVKSGAPVPLNANGVATLILNPAAGTYNVVANYLGDPAGATNPNIAPSSGSITEGIFNGSSTALTSSKNPSSVGDLVSFTAAVTSNAGTPSGLVDFFADGVKLGSTALNSSGVATFQTSSLSFGAHDIIAKYEGTAAYAASTSPDLFQDVRSLTATTLTGPAPSTTVTYGQTGVSLTATVAAKPSTNGTPTGSVVFVVDGQAQPPVSLTNGQASLSTSSLNAGHHIILANYQGDPSFAPSMSNSFAITISPVNTTVTITPSANPAGVGQAVTFTAGVNPTTTGGGPATGTVTFSINGVAQKTLTLVDGQASFSHTFSAVSNPMVTATYTPSGQNFNGNSLTITEHVLRASKVALTSSSDPSSPGQSVTFTAAVSPVVAGTATPTGSVSFFVDGSLAQTVTLNISGVARFSSSTLALGSHTIQAVYTSTNSYGGSSATLTQLVNIASATTISTSNGNIASGDPVTFTATVAPKSGSGAVPTGTVSFFINARTKPAFTTTLDAFGNATWSPISLPIGTDTITARYLGDGTYSPSSAAVVEKVRSPANRLVSKPAIGASVGTPFNVTVQALNNGALATTDNDPVRIIVVPPATGGTVLGNLSMNFSSGTATFQNLVVTKGGTYTLRILSDGLEVDVSVSTSGRQT